MSETTRNSWRKKSNVGKRASIHLRHPYSNFVETYGASMKNALQERQNHKIIEKVGPDKTEDMTPLPLEDKRINKKFKLLSRRICQYETSFTGDHLFEVYPQKSLLELAERNKFNWNAEMENPPASVRAEEVNETSVPPPCVKIVLRKTKEIPIYEHQSETQPRGAPEEEPFKFEDDRNRHSRAIETQTQSRLHLSRATHMPLLELRTTQSFVSRYLMSNAFENAGSSVNKAPPTESNGGDLLSRRSLLGEQCTEVQKSKEFNIALMKILRILAGNIYREAQLECRNLIPPIPTTTTDYVSRYAMQELFEFRTELLRRFRKSVSSLSFCPGNADIVAVGYGIVSFSTMRVPDTGFCCIWSIKNPVNPEQKYFFKSPVVSVEFCPSTPQLLAVGLYDGSVHIHDISTLSDREIAVSTRNENSTWDPVLSMEWISNGYASGVQNSEIELLLALSQDSTVTRYRLFNSPFLMGFRQMKLNHVQCSPEGLLVKRHWKNTQTNRHPQSLCIRKHPTDKTVYYVLTNEGCVQKCSLNFPNQHIRDLQAHVGSINAMDFSPWSPVLFLTAGNDCCVRVWMENIADPLITLVHGMTPVYDAAWSKTHSTIIVSTTQGRTFLWDIKRSITKPAYSTPVHKSRCTTFKQSLCGRYIAVGFERGSVQLFHLVLPHPSPYSIQYEDLESVIFRSIADNPSLAMEIRNMGYFGYDRGDKTTKFKQSHPCCSKV